MREVTYEFGLGDIWQTAKDAISFAKKHVARDGLPVKVSFVFNGISVCAYSSSEPPKPANAEQPSGKGLDETPCSASWIPATTKPTGWERKVLVWVVWPQCGWPQWPEPKIAWWKHGPGCFSVDNVENANHLVTHWMDISEPNTESIHPESKS